MKAERILSVGIDIGTTTMSMVISALTIGNTVYGFGIPSVKILTKEVLFRSAVQYTPFSQNGDIDQRRVEAFIAEQFQSAQIAPSQIGTGAVIVTGQAAEKKNAQAVVQAISRISGSFVVATAGAHLEAAISGCGAGMARFSSDKKYRVLNLDIGGGTTNAALFDNGILKRTYCFNIGGRLLQFLPGTFTVSRFTEPALKVASRLGISLRAGKEMRPDDARKIGEALARSLLSFISGVPDDLVLELSIDNRFDIPEEMADFISFSGGVGSLFYQKPPVNNSFCFDDLGPTLAEYLRFGISSLVVSVMQPEETLFATVIGAGIHTVNISGSTIYLSNIEDLPLRDNPVISLGDASSVGWEENMCLKLRSFSEGTGRLPAFFCGKMKKIGFAEVRKVADRIAALANSLGLQGPLVMLCEDDVGKILGGLLRNRISSEKSIISVDQIFAEEMNFVDIGKPVYGGTVVPVVVKTLVFPN